MPLSNHKVYSGSDTKLYLFDILSHVLEILNLKFHSQMKGANSGAASPRPLRHSMSLHYLTDPSITVESLLGETQDLRFARMRKEQNQPPSSLFVSDLLREERAVPTPKRTLKRSTTLTSLLEQKYPPALTQPSAPLLNIPKKTENERDIEKDYWRINQSTLKSHADELQTYVPLCARYERTLKL